MEKRPNLCDLPSSMPLVIFDIELGLQTHEINFDYHAFYELALLEGIPEEEINKLTIHFSASTRAQMYIKEGILGTYESQNRKVTIHRNAYTSQSALLQPPNPDRDYLDNGANLSHEQRGDTVLRHELGHWVDHIKNGHQEYGMKLRRKLYKAGGVLAVGATVAFPLSTGSWGLSILPATLYVGTFFADGVIYTIRNAVDKNLDSFDPRNTRREWPAYAFEARTRDYSLLAYNEKTK